MPPLAAPQLSKLSEVPSAYRACYDSTSPSSFKTHRLYLLSSLSLLFATTLEIVVYRHKLQRNIRQLFAMQKRYILRKNNRARVKGRTHLGDLQGSCHKGMYVYTSNIYDYVRRIWSWNILQTHITSKLRSI